jgi:DNA-binding HxlR family transcriptional regulator
MASRRSYGSYNDGCAAAHALDLIGERWTMIVVRELLLGPKRFSDVQRDVLGIGPAVLSQRLHELEASGVIHRRRLPGLGRIDVYELTEWGYGLEAVNTALSLWALSSPALPRDADMSPDTIVLAMRAHARPVSGYVNERRVALSLTDSRRQDAEPVTYVARMSAQTTSIDRLLESQHTDAEVSATTHDWKACVIGGVPLERLSDVSVSGSDDAVRQLIDATSLKDPSGATGVQSAPPLQLTPP